MSPWLREELRVLFGPGRVTLLTRRRMPSLRGWRYATGEPQVLPVEQAGATQPWRPALVALETSLPQAAKGGAKATVVLSNEFLRFALVPWQPGLAGAEEELSYARHCFARVYGKAALQWEIRLGDQPGQGPRLAAAVDGELLEELRRTFTAAGITLESIQPHLMAAFNGARPRLHLRSAWLALLEPGHVCLALLSEGRWSRLRSQRIDGPWPDEIRGILEREALLAEQETVSRDVYVGLMERGELALPDLEGWHFHALDSTPVGASPEAPKLQWTPVIAG